METGIKVGDCMKSSLVTVPDSTPVVDAARKMAETGVGSLLVTNQKGIYGIVTERDFVVKALARGNFASKVKDVCTKTLITIPRDADISLAARLMGEHNIKRLAAVDSSGQVVGIVSQKDLITVAPSLFDLISEPPLPKQAKLKVY